MSDFWTSPSAGDESSIRNYMREVGLVSEYSSACSTTSLTTVQSMSEHAQLRHTQLSGPPVLLQVRQTLVERQAVQAVGGMRMSGTQVVASKGAVAASMPAVS